MLKILIFFMSLSAFATVPIETLERLKKFYPDQTEGNILDRLTNAPTLFEKWQSFAPYYYEMLTRSVDILPKDFFTIKGECLGDGHLENFGFLFFDRPVFSLNDLDDAAPCALKSDAMRLFISHRFVGEVNAKDWLSEYSEGLSGLKKPLPQFMVVMESDSRSKAAGMPKKYKKLIDLRQCSGDFKRVPLAMEGVLNKFLLSEGKTFQFACSRTKTTGGSAGNTRYIVFYGRQSIEAIELKPLMTPAPLFGQSISIPERERMYQSSVINYLGENFSKVYYPVVILGKLYQRRPLWDGNVEIKLENLNSTELKEAMLFEARLLGQFHSKTEKRFSYNNPVEWESTAVAIEKKWKTEFGN